MVRFKNLLILVFIGLLFTVIIIGGKVPYFFLYICILLILVPLVHLLMMLRYVKGSLHLDNNSLYTGESINISYSLKNMGFLSIPYIEIYSDIARRLTGVNSKAYITSINKKSKINKVENITIRRRGEYTFGKIAVKVKDIFGIYTFEKVLSTPISLLVYPKTQHISNFKIGSTSQSGDLALRNPIFVDKSKIANLKEYAEGNDIRAIHWKLSAKKDTPVLKEYENSVDTYATLLIDNEYSLFSKDVNYHLEDKIVDASISIIDYCLRQGIPVNLITQNEKTLIDIKGQTSSDFKSFLDSLTRFKGNGSLSFKGIISSQMEVLRFSSTVIILTTNLNKEMISYGFDLKNKNINPVFILFTDIENNQGFIDQGILSRLNEESIPVYLIDHKDTVKEILEGYHGAI